MSAKLTLPLVTKTPTACPSTVVTTSTLASTLRIREKAFAAVTAVLAAALTRRIRSDADVAVTDRDAAPLAISSLMARADAENAMLSLALVNCNRSAAAEVDIAADADASNPRIAKTSPAAETLVAAEPRTNCTLSAVPDVVTATDALPTIRAINAAIAETDAAPLTLALVNWMRVTAPEAVRAVEAAPLTERLLVNSFAADTVVAAVPSTERLRVNSFAAETAADAEPSASLSLINAPSAVTCSEAAADILAMNAATAETEAAPVTLASNAKIFDCAAVDVTCKLTAADVVFVWPTVPTANGASENARRPNI